MSLVIRAHSHDSLILADSHIWEIRRATDERDAICDRRICDLHEILREPNKMHEKNLARIEQDARRESCRIVSSVQDLFRARNGAGCKIYFLLGTEADA